MINIEHTRYIGEIRRHSRANYPRIHSLRIQPQSSFQTQPLFGSSDACNLYIDFLDPAQHMNKKFISQSIHITLASVTPVMIFLRCMQSIYMSMPTHQDMSSRSIHLERRHSMPDREPLARLNLAQLRHETEPCMRGQNSKRGSTNTAKFMQAHTGSTRGRPLDHLCVLDKGMHGIFWKYIYGQHGIDLHCPRFHPAVMAVYPWYPWRCMIF